MAITPADFLVNLSPSPIRVVLGMSGNATMSFSNTSLTETGYNLAIEVILPDGVSFVSSSVVPTSIVNGPLGTIIVSWTNIKDLAPNELNYQIDMELNSDSHFRETGLPVPFDIPLESVDMSATLDTLPRGDDDVGNEKITKTDTADFIPLRYNLSKSAPGKMPKGAGLLDPPTAEVWPYEYTITLMNNTEFDSPITLIDNLPNGVRYLGNLSVVGPDSISLSSPTITTPSGLQDITIIDWGSVTLSAGSVNTITFDAAIWNNYTQGGVENSGDRIPHMAPLQNTIELDGESGIVVGTTTTNAMDATITKSSTPTLVDVGTIVTYTIRYRINQYDPVDDFVITDLLGSGQSYNSGSASITPTSVTINPDQTTEIVWELGTMAIGSSGTITFTSTVTSEFEPDEPVFAGDYLNNDVSADGINQNFLTPTPDGSLAVANVLIPTITKNLLNYYYKDDTLKPFPVASPGDLVEFEIIYDASFINAKQNNIKIDEYAPLNMGPLTSALPVVYGGTLPGPFAPFTVSPNGLRWDLGELPGHTYWTATFKIPVQDVVFVGERNNLAKLAGNDSDGFAYSFRDQVEVRFGEPNIAFDKTVSPTTNPVQAGELYTYSITISNLQNLEGNVTDAFNMLLTDVIPDGMSYTGVSSVVGTGSFTAPVFAGQNVSMTVTHLAPDQTLTLNYEVIVNAGFASGTILTNDAVLQQPYSQPDNSFQYPGEPFEASVTKNLFNLTIAKTGVPTQGKVGDDIEYTISFTVPEDTIAYTPRVIDILPIGQTYIGPATRQVPPAAPSVVVPVILGQNVTFPDNPDIDATGGAITVIYTFIARITDATQEPPYSETQTNRATVSWAVESGGPLVNTAETSFDITATTPNIDILKEQRNATLGGSYTTAEIVVESGNVIHYRLSITSNGASEAYNIVLSDILSDRLSFNSIIAGPSVGSVTLPSPPPSSTLIWEIPLLPEGAPVATLEFSVTVTEDPGAGEQFSNIATAVYDSNDVNPVSYDAESNEVIARAPRLSLFKNASKLTLEVGQTLTYIIDLTLPADVIAYNVVVSDILPDGQTYAGNAKRNFFAVTPTVVGQTVTFDTEAIIGPFTEDKIIRYSFNATVTSAEAPFPDIQTNESQVNWDVSPIGPPAEPDISTLDIEVLQQEPFRGISFDDVNKADKDFSNTQNKKR